MELTERLEINTIARWAIVEKIIFQQLLWIFEAGADFYEGEENRGEGRGRASREIPSGLQLLKNIYLLG